ncbi:MAG: hypothetical protein JSS40_16740 [Proteobacteria bacterium]|nr:hypothetical protein [Pseudomonadota bacterium]
MEHTGGTADDVAGEVSDDVAGEVSADELAESYARYARNFLHDDANAIGIHIDDENLPQVIKDALFDGFLKHRDAEELAAMVDSPQAAVSPVTQYMAISVAIAFVQKYGDIVVSGLQPQLPDAARKVGATTYRSWWAYHLAIHIAEVPDPKAGRPVGEPGRQMMKVLDAVLNSSSDHLENQIFPTLLSHLQSHLPSVSGKEELVGAGASGPTAAESTRPTDGSDRSSGANPEGKPSAEPVTEPASSLASGSITPGGLLERIRNPPRPIFLAATGLVILLVAGWLLSQPGDQSKSTPTAETPATVTVTAPVAPLGTPAPAPAETYSAPILSEVSLQVLAYPEGTAPDTAVQAVPRHPAQKSAVVAMGRSLTVQIRLTRANTATEDPAEQFFLGFWPSALLSVGDTYKTLPRQAPEKVPGLQATPPTLINSSELDETIPLVFEIEVAAAPLDGPPEESYNCGFNTTQAVNVLLSSANHPLPRVVTTLPLAVLRTERC